MKYFRKYKSPVGELTLISDGRALTGLDFENTPFRQDTSEMEYADLPVFRETAFWLDTYFRGENPGFTPTLLPKGTAFRLSVWEQLKKIPYGETTTYGAVAKKAAEERGTERMSAQAVGGAVGHNPIGIIIPCHRVMGAGGNLTGFSAGIEVKIFLLKLEGAYKESFHLPKG
ncbi:MAG: methylated-DNA--[protein]-cysteine S-methyltransferase [Clostridiales bacterium]|nr:methylated-DNA--[protein]-cysteine S-methyltransferase [Clostridiales bacterium]